MQFRITLVFFLHLEDKKLPSLVANDQLVIPITTDVPKTNGILGNSTLNLNTHFKCAKCLLTVDGCYLKGQTVDKSNRPHISAFSLH